DHSLEIEFDFQDHLLRIQVSHGGKASFALEPMSVAAFYRRFMAALTDLRISVRIHQRPNEVTEAIPFKDDEVHHSYNPEYANRSASGRSPLASVRSGRETGARLCSRPKRSIARISARSACRTRPYAWRSRRTMRCSRSANRPTTRRHASATGTARRSNGAGR